jgi:FkbM family methyltransferase
MSTPLYPLLAGFFEEEIKIFRSLKAAGLEVSTVFDVGASHGGWSWKMSEIFTEARFCLFEPLVGVIPDYLDYMTQTLSALPGSRLFKLALSDCNGTQLMLTDPEGYSASLLLKSATGILRDEVSITVRRLDDLMAEESLPAPDILKIDVQGGEMLVLRGLGEHLAKVKVIQAETWFTRAYGPDTPLFHEIHQFLAAHQFVFLDIGGRFYHSAHELYACDAFFVRRAVLEGLKDPLPNVPLT